MHTTHTHTHTIVYQGNGTEEKVFEKSMEDLKELTDRNRKLVPEKEHKKIYT